MLFLMEGQKALVTGASGAIGKAIALSLARQGASLMLSGMAGTGLEEVALEIKEQSGKEVHILECDLSKANETKDLVGKAVEKMNGLDILVNNAGINKDMLLARMTEEDFAAVLNVNLLAIFRLTKDAVAFMGTQRFGRIVNIASVVGFTGNIGQANYCASKSGLLGFAKAVALECARKGVTVNCVAPGFVRSAMTEKLSDAVREKLLAKIPMLRIAEPEDVAAACVFLASREAAYITGQTIHVNGGMLMA